ncbi:serine/threonine-protein kinase [Nocardia gipuzkoensis]|uniref:serine/threonine-protein kinase n=1 Tax=Nocardia gipuzkoensis TaxID=2749991 RepID=UPI0015EE9CCC|nr:serine/threonine-protein kinase [Nocardia gipuzkoensis]
MRELTPGQVFAGYVVQRRLGAGGMGAVYLARDLSLPRFVALKLLDSADDESRNRFLSEAEHIAQLEHPNIIAVYGRGSEDDQLWISMQYIDGGDAATAVRTCGALSAGRAVRIISEAAKGLDFAHAHGVLHRDVKPANILLGRPTGGQDERVVLADFGIAKALEFTQGLTGKGIRATLGYTAPERFKSSTAVDARADVYSLGCTLYHLITGSPPYSGTETQLMWAHCEAPIPQPSRVPSARDTGLPSALDSVIERALAKDPDKRPPSCRALAEAARQALDSAEPAHPTEPPDYTRPRSGPPVTLPTRKRHARRQTSAPSSQPATPLPDTVADQPVDHTFVSTNRADGFSTRCRQLLAAVQQALRSRPATPWWRRRSTAAAIAVVLLVLGVGVTMRCTIWPQSDGWVAEKTLEIAKPGDTDELSFSGTKGQKVFVEVASTNLPDQCFPLSLRDPVGKEVADGCIRDGGGFIDTTALPASGGYAVRLESSNDAVGEATVRVIDVVDQNATISPDGTPVTSTIDTPGAASRFRFVGTKGQKVFVEVASTNLPDHCFPLSLRDPVGKEIEEGCISDGGGSIDTTALPVDGEYTLVLDPEYTDRTSTGTGESQVRLFTVVDQDATISPDGTPVTSRIDTPGAVSRFRFAGTKGQKVSVEVALSTLTPSGCFLSLRDPVSEKIATGCIRSDGSGSIDITALPVDGEYTLVIAPEYTDPIRNGTGESQVRLYTR